MTRTRMLFLAALALLVGGIYYYLYRDYFRSPDIRIFYRISTREPMARRARPAVQSRANPVFFGFDRKLELTTVKVIPVAELATNKYAHPVWHLVSDSNSIPLKGFYYGMPIRGMRPRVPGAQPDPLEPGVKYRLFIEADGLTAQRDFVTTPRTAATR